MTQLHPLRKLSSLFLLSVVAFLFLAGSHAKAMYDPSTYRATDPAYPVTYTDSQKQAQLAAGTNMMNALIAAANSGATNYTVPPGVYRIYGGYYSLNHLQNFTLNCSNVEMWLDADAARNSLNWIHLNDCQNVRVLGPITFDSDNRLICQGTVTGWNAANGTIDLRIMPGYNATNFWAGNLCWHYDTNGVLLTRLNPTISTNYNPADLMQVRLTVGTNYFVEPGELLHVGDLMLARCWWANEKEPVLINNCHTVALSGIVSYDGGLWWNGSADTLLMTNCSNYREPHGNELGGGEEIWNMSPNILVFDGCNNGPGWDDAINSGGAGIHWVCGQPGSRMVLLHDQPAVGELMTFYQGENWLSEGQARVAAPPTLVTDPVEATNAITAVNNWMNFWGLRWRLATNQPLYAVTLDRDLPVTLCAMADRPGLHSESVVVRNCYFCDMNAQEILLRAYNSVLIESNLVERGDSWGVNCTATRYWWEGPAPQNITIRNNRFNNVPSAYGYRPEEVWDTDAILVGEDADGSPMAQTMGYVHITGNVFSNSLVHDVSVLNCYNVDISSNISYNAQPQPVGVGQYGQILNSSIYVAACSNVVLQGNQLLNPSPSCPNVVKVGPYVTGLSGSDVAAAVTLSNNPSPGWPTGVNASFTRATVQLTSPLQTAQAIYNFDGNTLDSSGYQRDGLAQGVAGGVTFVPGKIGQAVQMTNGRSLEFPCSIGLTSFTVSLWLKTVTPSTYGPPWYVGAHLLNGDAGGATEDFGVAICGNKFDLGIGNPDTDLQSAKVVTDGAWHHCVAEWDVNSGAMTVYVDGVLSGSKIGPAGPRWATSTRLDLGITGAVDDLRLYNYKLSLSEISALYNLQPPPVPPPPTGLAATAGDQQVSLSWSAAPGAPSYNVKRSLASEGPYSIVATNVDAISYTDTGLENGTTYFYEVASANVSGASADSAPVSATPLAGPVMPAAPSTLTLGTVSSNQITFSWTDNSPEETAFQIERSYDGVTFYAVGRVGVNVTNYTDAGLPSGNRYFYRVRAENNAVFSPPSNVIESTTLPGVPIALNATPGNGEVFLTWNASANAQSYRVKRATTSAGTFSIIASDVTTTQFLDASVVNGTTYYYVVSAVAGNGESADSIAASATPRPTPLVKAAYPFEGNVLDASGHGYNGINNNVTFVAGKVGSYAAQFDGASAYVQISRPVITNFTIAYWVKTTDIGGGGPWYSGHGLVDGEVGGVTMDFGTSLSGGQVAFGVGQPDTTIYSVSAINNNNWHHVAVTRNSITGLMQIYVDGILEASATGPAGPRTAPANLRMGCIQTGGNFFNGDLDDVRFYDDVMSATEIAGLAGLPPAPPTGLTAAAQAGQATLNWFASGGAINYRVYRGETPGGPYPELVATTTSLSVTNTGLTTGQEYYYVVTALNANGESAASAEASVTLHVPPILSVAAVAGSGEMTISWPSWAGDWNLFSATNLALPAIWLPVTNTVDVDADGFSVNLRVGPGAQFFRLMTPQ